MSNEALEGLIGKRVVIHSNTGDDNERDEGILEAFDYPWVRLNKGKGEILCFPVHNVRLIKLLERYQPESNTLLRPALPIADKEAKVETKEAKVETKEAKVETKEAKVETKTQKQSFFRS